MTTAAYTAKEIATERKPVELFHIWYGSTHYYYTNGDVSVAYGGNTYTPAMLQRGPLERDNTLNIVKMDIGFSYLENPVIDYIAQNPVALVWITVMRLFRDQSPLEAGVVFIGQIKTVTFQGNLGKVECVGFEHYLSRPLPLYRYMRQCNWKLFSTQCTVSVSNYSYTLNVSSISSDGLTIVCAALPVLVNDYFAQGEIVFSSERRMITTSASTSLYVRFPFKSLSVGDSVTVYAGCDGNITTCRDKFGNVINFGGTPYVPVDNPIIWGG